MRVGGRVELGDWLVLGARDRLRNRTFAVVTGAAR